MSYFNSNFDAALRSGRELNQLSRAISRSLARLSSGSRVQSPADDMAVYSVSQSLETQVRGYSRGILNMNEQSANIQVSSAAIDSQVSIVQKMRELAVQASNGLLRADERRSLGDEMQALVSEYQRIANEMDPSIESTRAEDILKRTVGANLYQNYTAYAGGNNAFSSGTSDIDGDGDLDLLTAENTDSTVSIYLNSGDGTFGTRRTLSTSSGAIGFHLLDVNDDNLDDMVYTDGTNMAVRMNRGNGNFSAATTVANGGTVYEYEMGDLNEDGFMDIVSSSFNHSYASIYYGDGNGSFQLGATVAGAGSMASDIALGDITGDGKLDLVVMDNLQTNTIYRNEGAGSFTSIQTFSGGTRAAIEDINHDGFADLITHNGSVGVRLNQGAGTFSAVITTSSVGTEYEPQLVDLNGDGNLDLLSQNYGTNTVTYLLGNGAGSFSDRKTVSHGIANAWMSLGDFNRDGAVDFVVSGGAGAGNNIFVYLQQTTEKYFSSDFTLSSVDHAKRAIESLDDGLERLVEIQSELGNLQTQLDISRDYSSSMIDALSEARSRISDADLAEETAELTRLQIHQQAKLASLMQANASMKAVLQLLNFR